MAKRSPPSPPLYGSTTPSTAAAAMAASAAVPPASNIEWAAAVAYGLPLATAPPWQLRPQAQRCDAEAAAAKQRTHERPEAQAAL
eukprot:CAMPEP_0179888032 /NCGR_PEP_ID=MMETSP0982-20121206/31727_1 /TAXON_ID=483367 /ORGANISM="non described non described, Strain CCMP 2436" /LENGTH=84 /DNA_ID=CAMNT_0021783911 /DNA_START=3149 /DNA_END=3404 /DNA_ORIENTATION=+